MRRPTLRGFSFFWLTFSLIGVSLVGLFILKEHLDVTHVLLYLGVVVCTTVVCMLLYARGIEKRLLGPLDEITKVTTAITEGAVSGRIALQDDAFLDVQLVAQAVNRLAEKATKDINEMRRLERVRSEFVANVSHELRTPIFSVQGYLETLLDGAMDDPAVSRQFLGKAHTNALRLNALLSDLIDISRIESGELRLSFRYFNMSELIRELVHSTEIRATQRNVAVNADPAMSTEVMCYGDKERLTQVLTNLIDNAIKYNVVGGTVIVCAKQEQQGLIRVSVSDTGIGIPIEDSTRIFERFYRVDKDRSRLVGGTGLGLAIVKHILEAHQAPFEVSSEVGKGTTITFRLKGD
ncbi:MAG: ATP-binding protein [bacterium]|nr:ATP-binding protein [bacterium]